MIDFTSKTSDELRDLIARGIFPPIAGADGAEEDGEAAAEVASEETPTVGEVFDRHAESEEQETSEESGEDDASGESEEPTGEEEENEESEEGIDLEQYNLALEFAADENHPQYDAAVEYLLEHAPDAVLERYGLVESEEGGEADETDILGDDATGIPEFDNALREIREFKAQMEEGRTQAEQQAAEEAEAQARENYETDFKELAGEDAPLVLSEMNPVQQAVAVSLLGVDTVEGVDDPKEFVAEMFKARDEQIKTEAIQEYIDGKSDFKLPPATGRNGSTTAKTPTNRHEAMVGLGEVFDRHANGTGEVSG